MMEFWYNIYPEHEAGFVRLAGRVEAADLARAVETFFNDLEWQAGYSLLWDSRAVRELAVLAGDARSLVSVLKKSRDRVVGSRMATVVAKETYQHFGQLVVLLAGWEDQVRVFSRFEQAVEWLNLDLALAAAVKKEFEAQAAGK